MGTNTSFQRQLLLFARLGCSWWPASPVCSLWREPKLEAMSKFREFTFRIADDVVSKTTSDVPIEQRQRLKIYIRDGVMRAEKGSNLAKAFDLDQASGTCEAAG